MSPTATDPGLLRELRALLGEPAVRSREIDRLAVGADASHFALTPQAVLVPADATEVGRIFALGIERRLPVTLRSGGTSLSGQGVTDGLLVDVRRHFTGIEILDGGARVRVGPGVTVRQLNAALARVGRKFGPDPASEAACTIGGVIADNSSGMACGTVENTYRTLESLVVVLPSGTVLDTAAPDADELLAATEPELHAGLLRLRDRVRGNPDSVRRIEQQYSMKNTMGYGLNSFLDHDSAAEILCHLLIGSEGTLGFIASAVFRTISLRDQVSSALLVFDDLHRANASLEALVASHAATVELLDAASLRVGQGLADCPPQIAALEVVDQAALLVEYQSTDPAELVELTTAAMPVLADLPLATRAELTSDPAIRGPWWKLRKGLYTSVAGARPSGTTALLEDIAVPVGALADTCTGLTGLFERHSYAGGVIFGHAKDGNVHFMITDRFAGETALRRYADFTEEMVELVLAAGGTLKAEHGTGRVMAPYVRRQFGEELYAVMRAVKELVDPHRVLNPGVLLDDDPEAHLRHIKAPTTVDAEVDRCVECGYCEPVCPSRNLTLTPRQRITARRAHTTAVAEGDADLAAALADQYEYDGLQTCAADGMCQTACPVAINTGSLVKKLRVEENPAPVQAAWTAAARHWGLATRAGSIGLSVAGALPSAVVEPVNRVARRIVGHDEVPLWSPELPTGGRGRSRQAAKPSALPGPAPVAPGAEPPPDPAPVPEPNAIYLPACVNAMFGPAPGGAGVQDAFTRICAAAGVSLIVPPGIDALCCGTPWSSKGMPAGHREMADRVRAMVAQLRAEGAPALVVSDASSCTEGFAAVLAEQGVEVIDAVQFTADHLLGRIRLRSTVDSLTLHPTCSSTQLGLDPALHRVAEAVADRVEVPLSWGCCAFAGDRGLLHPELTASATEAEAAEVVALDATAHASCNRTCELGMTRATGRGYRHLLELVADAL